MFLQLNLKCFRQHVKKSITYEEGLNVIRGANESGKSTLQEAIMYALFGSVALKEPLAATVTWGHKENELGVEFIMKMDNRLFKYTRSKAGAQVEYDGGIITGQNEVSKFTREVLGMDKDMAANLMFSNQTDIRGAIDAKPGAVAELIETMANFELFDTLLSVMDVELPKGSTKILDAQLLEAKEKVDALVLVEPDTAELERQISVEEGNKISAQNSVNALDAKVRDANAKWQSAQNLSRVYDSLKSNLDKAEADRDRKEVELETAKSVANGKSLLPQIEELKKQIDDVARTKTLMARALEVEELMTTYPEVFWDEPYPKYLEEVVRLENALKSAQEAKVEQNRVLQGAVESINLERSKLIHDTTCPTCKRAFEDASEILARNEVANEAIRTVQQRIDLEIMPEIHRLDAVVQEVGDDLETMRNLQQVARPFEKLAEAEFVEADANFYPPKLKWVGQVDFKHVEGKDLHATLTELKSAQEKIDTAKLKIPLLEQAVKDDSDQVERLKGQMAETNAVAPAEIEALKVAYNRLNNELAAAADDVVRHGNNIVTLQNEIRDARYSYDRSVQEKDRLQANVTKLQSDIDEMEFNNNLIAKVRKARPQIADQLWMLVLGSVTNMFTQMRGEPSLVTKDGDGFKVNGELASSYSGSAKDLLGLALRMSLMKTFLPGVSILVLDEPGAAMDDNRVNNMLGYIAAAGFEQVILITHEEVSETFADNVINL